jgi:hypothetical protein
MNAFLVFATPVRAHEVVPTIADMTVEDNGALRLDLRINLEALLSGIDLDAIADTDEAPEAGDYDALRALDPEALRARVGDLIAQWNAAGLITTSGGGIALTQTALVIPEVADFELPRISELAVQGTVPPGTETLSVNWPAGSGALVLRQQGVDAPFTGYLDGGQSSPPIALAGGDAQTPWEAFAAYVPVGFDHILPKGLDHILFVLGLFFLSTRLGPLLWQISAFTLAHTVTLALGALGLVNIPGSIVEPLIALSIVFVAVENVFTSGLSKWRPFVIFGFGLLHGLGFASVLGDFGLPEDQFIPALIGFNVGVELGQLAVIALAAVMLVLSVRLARRMYLPETEAPVGSYPVMFRAVSIPASLIIAAVGAYWCVERVFF